MPRPLSRKKIRTFAERFIIFLVGALAFPALSDVFQEGLLSSGALILMILVVVVIALYVLIETYTKIEEHFAQSEVTVRYIEERHREGVPFRGVIFDEL